MANNAKDMETQSLGGEGTTAILEDEESADHIPKPRRRQAWEFKRRQIEFMTLGATIGIGIFLRSAQVLFVGGPIAMVLAYLLMGLVAYCVTVSIAEIVSVLPIPGALFMVPSRILSPAIGYACGWAFWFSCIMIIPNEAVAMSEIIDYWGTAKNVPQGAWIAIFISLSILFNFLNVRRYGELEYWFTMTKVVTLTILIFLGILLPLGATTGGPLLGTNGTEPIHCNTINDTCLTSPDWREQPFKEIIVTGPGGAVISLLECCLTALFSYIGPESLGIIATETENPKTNLPPASRKIAKRLIFIYLGGAIALSLNISTNDPILTAAFQDSDLNYGGAFVLMLKRWGLPGFADFVNGVALLAAFGVTNVFLYLATRTLYALADAGWAPAIFKRKATRTDVPTYALIASSLPSALAFLALKVESASILTFLAEMATTAALASWVIICGTYIRWRQALRKQGRERMVDNNARAKGQPYLATFALFASTLLFGLSGYKAFTRSRSFWGLYTFDWGYSLAPYAVFAGLLLLIALRMVKYRLLDGHWNLRIPKFGRADITSGTAGPYREPEMSNWERKLDGLLNHI